MGVDIFAGESRKITAKISAHYVDNARELPWRVAPGGFKCGKLPDPYHIWLSEIMLQQTGVSAVKPYFEKFTRQWPTVSDLAAADEADILAAWAGLGYYARARNLYKCANYIVDKLGTSFPQKESEFLRLPGVGPYTAAAIAAIAFARRAVVVDANIERLVARLFAIDTPLPPGKVEIRAGMDRLTPEDGAGDFAQACMDIGATICTAKNPKCEVCPVQSDCAAYDMKAPDRFPVKPPKKPKPVRKARFFWIEQNGKLLLVTRPSRGMLAGMRALPDDGWTVAGDGHRKPPVSGKWDIHQNIVQHSFTHFSLEVDLAIYKGGDQSDKPAIDTSDNIWWPVNQLEDAGLATLYKKAAGWLGERKLKE